MAFGLARFDLSTITRRFPMPEISADPAKPMTLILRFVGAGNRAWEAWQFGRDAAKQPDAPVQSETPSTLEVREENRAFATEAMLAVGLVGWEHVYEDGAAAEFTSGAAARFMSELAASCPDVLTRAANFAFDRSNFRGAAAPDPVDLGKG